MVKRYRVSRFVVSGGLVAVFTVAALVRLNAQGGNPLTAIQNTVDATLVAVNAVRDDVAAILAAVKPAPAPVLLSTGYARAETDDQLLCLLANVGPTDLGRVDQRAVNLFGTVGPSGYAGSVASGTGTGGGGNVSAGNWRCEFEFEGLASSVRATMVIRQGLNGPVRFVLDAR
jgi:hypothetical protein